jgi:hypothetical protein
MKREVSMLFLLFASVIILAHTFISHHHHDGIPIKITATHHDNDQPDDLYETDIDYVRFRIEKRDFQLFDYHFNVPASILALLSDNSILQRTDETGLFFRQKPYLLSYHTAFITLSIGLRAPPVC